MHSTHAHTSFSPALLIEATTIMNEIYNKHTKTTSRIIRCMQSDWKCWRVIVETEKSYDHAINANFSMVLLKRSPCWLALNYCSVLLMYTSAAAWMDIYTYRKAWFACVYLFKHLLLLLLFLCGMIVFCSFFSAAPNCMFYAFQWTGCDKIHPKCANESNWWPLQCVCLH